MQTVEDFVAYEYPSSEVLFNLRDGINQSCVFKRDDSKYVAKLFTSEIIDTQDYLGIAEISKSHLTEYGDFQTINVQDSGIHNGTAYIVYDYVDGYTLDFDKLNDTGDLESYIERIANMLSDMHMISNPVDGFGWYTYADREVVLNKHYKNSTDMILDYLDYNLERIDDRDFVLTYEDQIRSVISENIKYDGDPCIGHCDVKYGNIIESNENRLCLIDWEFARSVDPMYDFVKAERELLRGYPPKFSDDRADNLRTIFRSAYFDDGEFEVRRYYAYWIHEMVSRLRQARKWYPNADLDKVRQYYKNSILNYTERLSNSPETIS